MREYNSIQEAVEDLKKRGYTYDFNLDKDHMVIPTTAGKFEGKEFKITETYRFEGATNPSESAIVYAIESETHSMKGYLINAYGVYSDSRFSDFISKMELEHHEIINE